MITPSRKLKTIVRAAKKYKLREREKRVFLVLFIQRGGSPIGNSISAEFSNQHSKLGTAGATSSNSGSNSDKPRSKRDETTIRELEVYLGYYPSDTTHSSSLL